MRPATTAAAYDQGRKYSCCCCCIQATINGTIDLFTKRIFWLLNPCLVLEEAMKAEWAKAQSKLIFRWSHQCPLYICASAGVQTISADSCKPTFQMSWLMALSPCSGNALCCSPNCYFCDYHAQII